MSKDNQEVPNFDTINDVRVKYEYRRSKKQITLKVNGEIIYENGVFTKNLEELRKLIPNLTEANLKELHDKVRERNNRLGADKVNIPTNHGVRGASPGTPGTPGTPAGLPPIFTRVGPNIFNMPSINLTDILADVLKLEIKLDEYGSSLASLRELYGDKPLKYPSNILEFQQDTLHITQYQYKPPYGDIIANGEEIRVPVPDVTSPMLMFQTLFATTSLDRLRYFTGGAQRKSALKIDVAKVILPIPNNVSDSNQTNWGPDNMDALSMAAAGNIPLVGSSVVTGGLLETLGSAGSAVLPAGKAKAVADLLKTFGKSATNLTSLLLLMGPGGLINPLFQTSLYEMILKQAGFNINSEQILARGHGVVPNSNMELLFSGPSLRTFSFGYLMTPRSLDEARTCRKIIRFFKQGMAPKKKNNTGGYGGRSLLLATPNVFKLEYKTPGPNGSKLISGLNRFKICALTNINTSYAEGAWAAYREGQPVRMHIQLTFKEIEPVYESDYSSKKANFEDKEGKDELSPVTNDDIGY